jgi:hypothetical protein
MKKTRVAVLLCFLLTFPAWPQAYNVKPVPKGAKVAIQVPDIDCDSSRLRDRLARNLTDKDLAPVDVLSDGAFILRVRFKKRISRISSTKLLLDIKVRERGARDPSTVTTSWDDAETVKPVAITHAVIEQVTVFGPRVRRVKIADNFGADIRSELLASLKQLGYAVDDKEPDLVLEVNSRREPHQRQFEFLDYDFKLASRSGQELAYGNGTIEDREVAGIPIDTVAYAAQRITGAISVR